MQCEGKKNRVLTIVFASEAAVAQDLEAEVAAFYPCALGGLPMKEHREWRKCLNGMVPVSGAFVPHTLNRHYK